MNWFLFVLCVTPQDRLDVWIAIDDSIHSQLLKSELIRDWSRYGRCNVERSICREMSQYQSQVNFHWNIHYVTKYDVDYPQRDRYPQIKVGRYGQYQPVDRRAFRMSTMPLRYMKWNVEDWYHPDYERAYDISYYAKLRNYDWAMKEFWLSFRKKHPEYTFSGDDYWVEVYDEQGDPVPVHRFERPCYRKLARPCRPWIPHEELQASRACSLICNWSIPTRLPWPE